MASSSWAVSVDHFATGHWGFEKGLEIATTNPSRTLLLPLVHVKSLKTFAGQTKSFYMHQEGSHMQSMIGATELQF